MYGDDSRGRDGGGLCGRTAVLPREEMTLDVSGWVSIQG